MERRGSMDGKTASLRRARPPRPRVRTAGPDRGRGGKEGKNEDAQTITCSFPTPPEPGVYTLEVACRNGNRVSLAPAVARLKNVVVKAA